MNKNNMEIAKSYYTAMGKKNIQEFEQYLHPDVKVISPLIEKTGKEVVLEALKGFIAAFNTLMIRAAFDSPDQAILVIDVDYPAPIGNIRTASLISIQDALIVKIELFFDGRPFQTRLV